MPPRVLHVIDLAQSSWPAAASLAMLQRAKSETPSQPHTDAVLAFGSTMQLALARSTGLRACALRPASTAAWDALAIAQQAKRARADIAHAWRPRCLRAASLAARIAPRLRVSCTLIGAERLLERPLHKRISLILAGAGSASETSQLGGARARIVADPPLRATPLNAQGAAAQRARWGAPAGATIIAQLGEPEEALDAHAFASVILALRLLGIDAFGVSSARARLAPAAVDLASRLAGREILAFEPLPPTAWLSACHAGLWGAFDESVAPRANGRSRVGRAGALAALASCVPVAAAPDALSGGLAGATHTLLTQAPGRTPISLAGALLQALASHAQARRETTPAADDAQQRADWLMSHERLWDSLMRPQDCSSPSR